MPYKDPVKKRKNNAKYRKEHKEYFKEYFKEYRRKHKKKIQKQIQGWVKKNRKRVNEYYRSWVKKNRKRVNEYYRKWYCQNKEKVRAKDKLRRELYPEKIKENYRRWVRRNPEKVYYLWKIYNARVKNAEGSHTFGEWELLKKQYGYRCPACGKKEPEIKLTEDHIIPLSKGGSDYIENIQPLCRSCNSKKHTKIVKYEVSERVLLLEK